MKLGHYILDDDHNIIEVDLLTWGRWLEKAKDVRRVKQDFIEDSLLKIEYNVSTVFLGIDHNFSDDDGPPVLFETMIFGEAGEEYCDRCCTWDEAIEMHNKALRHLKGILLEREEYELIEKIDKALK
jgi:hypothetical protein